MRVQASHLGLHLFIYKNFQERLSPPPPPQLPGADAEIKLSELMHVAASESYTDLQKGLLIFTLPCIVSTRYIL